jgi:hypothetical protein
MRVSITSNQRVAIYRDNTLIALLDEMGVPIVTPKFFELSTIEATTFWSLVNQFKVDY